jgi:hypothetical protein
MIPDQAKRNGVRPVWVAFVIAFFGIVTMLVVDHGPWSRPHAQSAEIAGHLTAGDAAHAVGAPAAPPNPSH